MQVNISLHFLKKISAASLVSISIFFAVAPPVYSQQPSSQNNLAKVALLIYENRTGSENYSYLSESITTSVDSNMQAKFDFSPIDAGSAEKTAGELRAKSGKFGNAEAAEFCKLTGTDILIYGSYEHDLISNQIVIKTEINFALINRTLALEPLSNPIDASLFQVTEIAATKIVEKIAEMAKKTMNKAGASADTSTTAAIDQKVTLSKIEEVTWNKVNHEVILAGGLSRGADNKLSQFNSGYAGSISILRNSDFRKSFAGLSAMSLSQDGQAGTHKAWGVLIGLGLAPFTIVNRIRPFIQADIGYGSSTINTKKSQTEGGVWLGLRAGIKFLIADRVSVGIDGQWIKITGDLNSSVQVLNLGLGFNF